MWTVFLLEHNSRVTLTLSVYLLPMAEEPNWFSEVLSKSINSLANLMEMIDEIFFPTSNMFKLRDNIQNFELVHGETIHQTWLRFQKFLLQCHTHGLQDNVLFQYFYWIHNTVNKGVVDQLIRDGIMTKPFDIATMLLDEMAKINQDFIQGKIKCLL